MPSQHPDHDVDNDRIRIRQLGALRADRDVQVHIDRLRRQRDKARAQRDRARGRQDRAYREVRRALETRDATQDRVGELEDDAQAMLATIDRLQTALQVATTETGLLRAGHPEANLIARLATQTAIVEAATRFVSACNDGGLSGSARDAVLWRALTDAVHDHTPNPGTPDG